MKLWTPDGIQTFLIKMDEAGCHNLKEGTLVTVEIDELGPVYGYPSELVIRSIDKD